MKRLDELFRLNELVEREITQLAIQYQIPSK
jgi:hypothetical protein